ncbi:hypothetical protein P7H70_13865 [Vagococcus carniphilus]|uniref:Uncharacterized protein n=1 Tax=Vagococcus carniphilus TaxID=218144 RepID=A0AAW8U6J7_9ENTE|nr:hypothetical protein [Vagococcus carniphilus]MDT2835123.1 hypothetical protein [Vagococcus carniphilus]
MKECFFDNNGIFQWGSVTALVAVGTLVFSFLNFINSRKTINQHKELELGKQESAKKNHIREEISEYLAELTKMNQIAKNFFNVRRELEGSQNFLSQLIHDNVNLDYMLGSDPRVDVENRSIELNECVLQWNETSEMIEQKAQELLLLFRNDEQEENKIDQLIMFCPERLSGLKWVLTTNLPGDMLAAAVEDFSIEKNIVEIRTFMRDYLN